MPNLPIPDDQVAPFQIEGEPVRGRLARLGPSVDEILRAHAYPEPVANLLGKRYTCEECGAQVLVTKAGDGALMCHDRSMEVMQPKPLPSSD